MARFPSKEWCEDAVRLLNDDPERSLAAQGWQGDIGVIVDAEPGKLARAPYTVWKQLLQGSLDPVEAVLRRRIAVKGDLQQVIERLRFKGIADRLLADLKTEFVDEQ